MTRVIRRDAIDRVTVVSLVRATQLISAACCIMYHKH